MILVGVDPGKVTGIAVWWSPEYFDSTERGGLPVDTAEVEAAAVRPVLVRMLGGHRPTLVAVERYRQTGRKTHQPHAYEVTGVVKSLAEEWLVRCVYQSPSPAQKVGSPELLRRLGWFVKTRDGHANAALGNVLLLMATFHSEVYASLTGI